MSRPQGTFPVELGDSFWRRTTFHTLRYNFKPHTVFGSRTGRLRVKEQRAVELRVDGADADDETTMFRGHVEEQKQTECMLICGLDGKWRLERVTSTFKNLTADRSGRTSAGAGASAAAGGSSRAHEAAHAPHAQAEPPRARGASTSAADDVDEEQLFGGDEDESDEPASAAASTPALGIQLQEAPAHADGGDLSDSVSDSVSDSGD